MGATGELVAVDNSSRAPSRVVGEVYIQTVHDFSRHVWARHYTSKMPVTAVQILNDQALPFSEAHSVRVPTILERQRPLRGAGLGFPSTGVAPL